ncbi:ABC transporter substrate-binding protein [Streptomyces sp. GMY02]|uniref:bifunctional serine/threonine-protein kinase/ABC transporter substrate-binding protein n=1 Tax=Streptomyces sp. GMY02 TaxID=1333528 RepID=UPI001C2BFD1F|nr:bifunctional serine/threonine-protein kinase/ABC transporter substrate-binding protein [Streptomyces sp. GMY02]QXE37681.1 ABC transporter substrate-binding protein [Streptomyces sp. GMY02]
MTGPLLPSDPSSIGGHRLLGRLGAGGMGVVYLGRTESGGLVAVKVIQADFAADSDFRTRFRREVQAARRVSSPWAVAVTGADPEADEPWLATAFVPGPSLAEAVGRCGPLPVRSVRVLGRMLAEALREVHAQGLVHRDVKPGNVLLAVDGPRLIDFGISRSADDTVITSADVVVGTPGFLSPEQAQTAGGPPGPASDVFSLGCLLAYAATGRPPFGTGTADALLYRTVHDEPDLDGVGPGLLDVLRSCLAKDPARRPVPERLAAELVEDAPRGSVDWLPEEVVRLIADRSAELLALPDIEPTVAEPSDATGPTESARQEERPSRRRLLALTGGAVLLAAGAGTATWAALRGGGEDDRTAGPRPWAIGVQADLSGGSGAAGRAQEQGARLAVEQFNRRAGRPFELALRTADDGGVPARAAAGAKRMAADRDVLAVLGPTTDDTALAVLGSYDEALLPLLCVSAGGLNLAAQEYRSFLHCRPSDAAVSVPLAVYLAASGAAGPVGVLQDRTGEQYAWESAQITASMLRLYELPLYPRVVPAGTENLRPVVADMLRAGVGSFVYAGDPAGAARVAKELAATGFSKPRLAPQAVLDPVFTREAGAAADGWVVAASFTDPAALPAAKAFTTAFRERYGSPPGYYAAEAYDTANLVIGELVKAAKAKKGGRPSRQELVGLLRRSTHQGVTKRFSFKPEDGSFAGQGVFFHTVENGAFRFLGRAPAPPA